MDVPGTGRALSFYVFLTGFDKYLFLVRTCRELDGRTRFVIGVGMECVMLVCFVIDKDGFCL